MKNGISKLFLESRWGRTVFPEEQCMKNVGEGFYPAFSILIFKIAKKCKPSKHTHIIKPYYREMDTFGFTIRWGCELAWRRRLGGLTWTYLIGLFTPKVIQRKGIAPSGQWDYRGTGWDGGRFVESLIWIRNLWDCRVESISQFQVISPAPQFHEVFSTKKKGTDVIAPDPSELWGNILDWTFTGWIITLKNRWDLLQQVE